MTPARLEPRVRTKTVPESWPDRHAWRTKLRSPARVVCNPARGEGLAGSGPLARCTSQRTSVVRPHALTPVCTSARAVPLMFTIASRNCCPSIPCKRSRMSSMLGRPLSGFSLIWVMPSFQEDERRAGSLPGCVRREVRSRAGCCGRLRILPILYTVLYTVPDLPRKIQGEPQQRSVQPALAPLQVF